MAKLPGAGPVTTPHHPYNCYGSGLHCHWHQVDEFAAEPYRVCFECKHTFATAAELLAGHNAILTGLNRNVRPDGDPLFETTEPIPMETDPAKVSCCPYCIHDF